MHSSLRSLLLRPLGFVLGATTALAVGAAYGAPIAQKNSGWLGEELPLPLSVRTPQDLAVKNVAERQYLIFNLLAIPPPSSSGTALVRRSTTSRASASSSSHTRASPICPICTLER